VTGIVATGGDPTRVTGRRAFGAILEGLIDLGVLATLVKVFDFKVTQTKAGYYGPEKVDGKLVLISVLYLVYVLGTKVVTLGLKGWTPGMLLMQVRCVGVDGRPPGLPRAFLRTAFYGVGQYIGQCFFWAVVWAPMVFSKTHRGFQDMIAGTFVIDSIYLGHLLLDEPGATGRVYVGPKSVTRKEADKFHQQAAAAAGQPGVFQAPVLTAAMRSGQPFLDKNLDTYVVWNVKQEAWLAFDKASNTWYRIG